VIEEIHKMSAAKLIKVGIIGAGGIGETHLEALFRIGGVEVTAICRRDRDWATAYAEKHAIPKIYTDYRELINDNDVEVVHVASPNNLHYEHVMYALDAGKHVVCDKPLGINVAQTFQMLSRAKEKKLAHALCYNHRFLPLIFQMREMVKRGELGKLTLIRGYALGDFMLGIADIDSNHWRTRPETVGLSKTMSVMGGHLLDLLQFTSGLRAKEIFADFGYIDPSKEGITFDGQNYVKEKGGQLEDHANLLLRFGDGIKGAVTLSEAAPGHKVEVFLELIGTKACVAWNLQKINEIWIGIKEKPSGVLYKGFDLLYPEAQRVAAPPAWGQDGFSESFRQLFAAIYDHIREKKYLQDVESDFANFEAGHYMELILQAMMNSVREERWQEIEDKGV
jgi:predicted dehydrogenase